MWQWLIQKKRKKKKTMNPKNCYLENCKFKLEKRDRHCLKVNLGALYLKSADVSNSG